MLRAILLLSAICVMAATQEESPQFMSCTAGHFTEGKNASVTCHFSSDVSSEHYHFYVDWFPFNSSIGGKDILICFMTSEKTLKCELEDGYHFNYKITDKLTLEIPHVTTEFAGRYTCQHVPPGEKIKNHCELTVTALGSKRQTSTKPTTNPGTVLGAETSKTSQETHNIIAVVVLVLVVILVITLAVFITWKYLLKHKKSCKESRRNSRKKNSCNLTDDSDRESEAKMLSYDDWKKDLPKPVKKSLERARLTSMATVGEATEEDITSLKLLPGDRIRFKQKLAILRTESWKLSADIQPNVAQETQDESETNTKDVKRHVSTQDKDHDSQPAASQVMTGNQKTTDSRGAQADSAPNNASCPTHSVQDGLDKRLGETPPSQTKIESTLSTSQGTSSKNKPPLVDRTDINESGNVSQETENHLTNANSAEN